MNTRFFGTATDNIFFISFEFLYYDSSLMDFVTVAWYVLRLRMKETAFRYGKVATNKLPDS